VLTQIQRDTLLKPIRPARVKQTQGNSYLEAWDVTAYLTKVFGFEGWDKEIVRLDVIAADHVTWIPKDKQGNPLPPKEGWDVCYRCDIRLTIRDPQGVVVKIIEDASTGAATHQPYLADAHDLAMKSAVSGALKRCAKDLGDQFGLGLYDDGSLAPCLGRVVIYEGVSAQNPDDGSTAPPAASEAPPEPEPEHSPEKANAISSLQRSRLFATANAKKVDAHEVVRQVIGVAGSINSLTSAQASKVIDYLNTLEVATA